MSIAAYQVRVKSAAGALTAFIGEEELLELEIVKAVNGVHTHRLTLDASASNKGALFALDGQVEVWRRPVGEDWYLEYEGLHRRPEWRQDAQGAETFTSRGVGYQDLLARRIVAAAAGSTDAAKSGAAETVIKAFVAAQAGSGAAAARQIPGLTVQADAAGGNSIAVACAYRNLLEVCQDIARIGGGDFDVVGTGAATWEFRWYAGQRGADHTVATGTNPVIFSTAFGNMASPYQIDTPAVATAVLVGGQGEGAARTTVWRPATLPTGLNRRESFRDARDVDTTALLNNRGDVTLDEASATVEFGFEVLETPSVAYGVHYGLGDLVTGRYRSTDYNLQVIKVTVRLDRARGERIEPEFESV